MRERIWRERGVWRERIGEREREEREKRGGCCPLSIAHGQARRPGRGLARAGAGSPPVAAGQGWPRRPPQREERERDPGRERESSGGRGAAAPAPQPLVTAWLCQASPGRVARGAKGAAPGAAPPDRGGHAGRPSRGEGKIKRKEKEKEKKKRKRKEGLAGVAGRRRSLAGGGGVDGGGGQFLGRKRERKVGEIEGWRRKMRR